MKNLIDNSLHTQLRNQNAKEENIYNNQDRICLKRTAKVSLILRAIIGAFKNVDHTTQLCALAVAWLLPPIHLVSREQLLESIRLFSPD